MPGRQVRVGVLVLFVAAGRDRCAAGTTWIVVQMPGAGGLLAWKASVDIVLADRWDPTAVVALGRFHRRASTGWAHVRA